MSYDQNILMSRTGSKLLNLFDKMESLVSKLYHNSLTDSSIESEYFSVYEEVEKLRIVRDKLIRKNRRRNMF